MVRGHGLLAVGLRPAMGGLREGDITFCFNILTRIGQGVRVVRGEHCHFGPLLLGAMCSAVTIDPSVIDRVFEVSSVG
jgi:hypothetical protein